MALVRDERTTVGVIQFDPQSQPSLGTGFGYSNGAMWYDSSSNSFMGMVNGVATPVGGSSGGSFGASPSSAYTFAVSGGIVSATNSKTGIVDFSGTDAGVVINNAINNVASTCGTLFFKNGIYNINSFQTESTGGYSLSYGIGLPSSVSSGAYCEWQIIGEALGGTNYGVATGSQVNLTLGNNGVIFNVTPTAVSSVTAGTFLANIWVRPDVVNGIGPNVTIKNILTRMPSNQRGNTGHIMLWNSAQTLLENISWDFANLGTNIPFPVKGTIGSFGVTTTNGGKGWNNWKRIQGHGADLAYDIQAEITHLDSVATQASNFAYYVGGGADYSTLIQNPGATYHPSIFVHGGWSECARGLTFGSKMKSGTRLDWPGLVIEENSSGSFAPVYRMTETNTNFTSGVFTYTIVTSALGVTNVAENPPTQMFLAGGQNIQLYESTTAFNTLLGPAFDSFTHPNIAVGSSSLSPAWRSNSNGFAYACGITSNTLVTSNGTSCLISWAAQNFNNDQFSRLTVAGIDANSFVTAVVRASQTPQVKTFYEYGCSTAGGAVPKRKITKWIANTATDLVTTAANSGCVANDVLELDVIGTTLVGYYNGVIDLIVIDSAIASGSPGTDIVSISGTAGAVSTWSGGSLAIKNNSESVYGRPLFAPTYNTLTNCNPGSSVSPAACGSAASGTVVVPTTTTTYTVNTTAVTTNSRIVIQPITDASGLTGSPTCVAPPTPFIAYESGRTAGTSFTFTLPSTTGASCWTYWIVN